MSRVGKFTLYIFIGIAMTLIVALLTHYQFRLKALEGKLLIVGFSKGAWVECLSETKLVGQIDSVDLQGITITDKSGEFTMKNLQKNAVNGSKICPGLDIVIKDVERRQYYVPFSYVGGLRENDKWLWSNPFPA